MIERAAADAVVAVHLLFVIFVLCGALLALRWPRIAWIHVPAVAWGAFIEYSGWICPLTPLEQALRRAAGAAGYEGGFVAHYVLGLLYPETLTRGLQIGIGTAVLVINGAAYAWIVRRHFRQRRDA